MNFKKILSVVSACAVTAAAGMNLITASAAVREITYTGPSSGAFAKNDDGVLHCVLIFITSGSTP